MLFDRKSYFVKERVAFVKLTDTYDILDPESKTPVGVAKEAPPTWAKYLRLLINKKLLPTTVEIYEQEAAPPVLTLHKTPGFLRAKVRVTNGCQAELGQFVSKVFALGGGFVINGADGQRFAEVRGDWKGWNFRFLDSAGREIGLVTKKWAGIGKELFTSSDNYMIALSDATPARPEHAALLLAAGLALDIVFKEKN